jgi:hypothetical protein
MCFIKFVFAILLSTSQTNGNVKLWQQTVTLGQADLWETGVHFTNILRATFQTKIIQLFLTNDKGFLNFVTIKVCIILL